MNWRGTALTLIATLLLEGAVLAAPYTVQSGDTLYSLAKRFMTTPAALQAANKLGNTVLRVGQILEIPERVHTVQKGETLYGVARFYEVTVAQVRQLNALSADSVEVGQKLLIPWNFGAASNAFGGRARTSDDGVTSAATPPQWPASTPGMSIFTVESAPSSTSTFIDLRSSAMSSSSFARSLSCESFTRMERSASS